VTLVLKHREGRPSLRLKGEVDVAHAVEAKAFWVRALASGKELTAKLERAADMDCTAFHLIHGMQLNATIAGTGFAVEGEAPLQVSAAITHAGYEELTAPKAER
jgi:hypothetical protein